MQIINGKVGTFLLFYKYLGAELFWGEKAPDKPGRTTHITEKAKQRKNRQRKYRKSLSRWDWRRSAWKKRKLLHRSCGTMRRHLL